MNKSLPKVIVVAHDAGCSEVIAAYIEKNKKMNFLVYAVGPAKKIFKKRKIPFHILQNNRKKIIHILKKNSNISYLLTGSGWMSSIYLTACFEAKKMGMKTVVYLDSWGDYRIRFGCPKKNWRAYLPDELWVGDIYAQRLAKKYFSDKVVRFVPNEYFRSAISRFRALAKNKKLFDILFLSRSGSSASLVFAELCVHLASLSEFKSICIRFHPVEDTYRFDGLIKKYRGKIKIIKSQNIDIVDDLAVAQTVLGIDTVAMAVSVLVGIKTISVLKAGEKAVVPFRGIKRVYSVEDALKLI